MGCHCGRRARKCGECVRQGRGSARSLRVFDLKAAVTPSLLARRALARRMPECWHLGTSPGSRRRSQEVARIAGTIAPDDYQLSPACCGRTADRQSVPARVSGKKRYVFPDIHHLRLDPAMHGGRLKQIKNVELSTHTLDSLTCTMLLSRRLLRKESSGDALYQTRQSTSHRL